MLQSATVYRSKHAAGKVAVKKGKNMDIKKNSAV